VRVSPGKRQSPYEERQRRFAAARFASDGALPLTSAIHVLLPTKQDVDAR
jgi:hypothetical protein